MSRARTSIFPQPPFSFPLDLFRVDGKHRRKVKVRVTAKGGQPEGAIEKVNVINAALKADGGM